MLATFLLAVLLQTAPATQPATAAPPMEFDTYHFVLLVAAESPPEDMTREKATEIQGQHLGHLTKMWEQGYALVAGPFGDRIDPRWRGMVLYRGDLTKEQVIELASADPAVQAGLLEVKVMAWYTAKDMLEFKAPPSTQPADGE
ncbi:MAG: hypothetical protein AAGD32_13340 [Planctomycetota bacterium]